MAKRAVAGFSIILIAVYIITTVTGGFQTLNYEVENWQEEGFTTGAMVATTDRIYLETDTGASGTWSSEIFNYGQHYPVSSSVQGDARDGTVTLTINMWNENATGTPDEVITNNIETGVNEFEYDYNESDTYDYFEFVIDIEDGGQQAERPYVEQMTINLESEQADYTDFNNIFLLFALLLLMWGLYAVLS